MITSAKQLKARIRNLAAEHRADAQILLRNYMIECFLRRLVASEYRDKFIVKGGVLIASMVGLEARSTMDLDAAVTGLDVNSHTLHEIVSQILNVSCDDGVVFSLQHISAIMDDAKYPGLRIGMQAAFDGIQVPVKMDISTGNDIQSNPRIYEYKLMLENTSIEIYAYALEALLAEKLETILYRSVLNTRMRDFYDVYILLEHFRNSLSASDFNDALISTMKFRGTADLLKNNQHIITMIEHDAAMMERWVIYQKKYSYAESIPWNTVIKSVMELTDKLEKPHVF